MIMIEGERTEETIVLDNGYIIRIDYGDSTKDFSFRSTNYSGVFRRTRLYDAEENLISEAVEENPDKRDVSYNLSEGHDPSVIL